MFEDYVEQIKKYRDDHFKIYIYGAGKAAHIVRQLCNDYQIPADGFCVTDVRQNRNELDGLPVYQFDALRFDPSKTLFLVGALEKGEHKIGRHIMDVGGQYILELPDNILTYDKWEDERRRRPALEITPIIGCSVNCRYCPQKTLLNQYFKDDRQRKRVFTLEEYKRILDKLPQNTLIEFAGFVEPFLNRDAAKMMEYTAERGFEMTLFTTLVGLDMETLERVLALPFSIVCLHTPDEKGYANIPITPSYLQMLRKIVDAKGRDGNPFVTTANCQSSPHPDILPITEGKLKIWVELTDRAGNLDPNDDALAHTEKHGRISCTRANNVDHFVLLPDGSVVLCCNDFGMQHVLGNLLENSYEEIVHGEEMRNIKRGMVMDETIPVLCRKCVYAVEWQDDESSHI